MSQAAICRVAVTLVMASWVNAGTGMAQAAGAPFTFTVPSAGPGATGVNLQYTAGYGERTFEPMAGDGFAQEVALSASLWNRVQLLASSGIALSDATPTRSVWQGEALVDALRVRAWSLALGAGVRREYDGSTMALTRASVSHVTPSWTLVGNFLIGKVVAGSDLAEHDDADLYASVGATAALTGALSGGIEVVASDLEGFWTPDEAEGGSTIFAGPVLALRLPGARGARLLLSAGPMVRATGTGIASYPALGTGGLRQVTPRLGYLVRSAVSLGL